MSANKIPVEPIPDDREVIGQDINDIASAFNFTTLDSAYLLGVYLPKLGKLTSDIVSESDRKRGVTVPGRIRPIANPTRSLLLRYISKHPEHCPIKPSPTPNEVFEAIQQTEGYEDYKQRHLAPLLGCELSSGYRWFSGARASPLLGRYLSIIMSLLADLSSHDRREVLDELRSLAEVEAASRGVSADRLWAKGTWSKPKQNK